MKYKVTPLSLVFMLAFVTSIFAQTLPESVLIKLTLEKPSDYEEAAFLGTVHAPYDSATKM